MVMCGQTSEISCLLRTIIGAGIAKDHATTAAMMASLSHGELQLHVGGDEYDDKKKNANQRC